MMATAAATTAPARSPPRKPHRRRSENDSPDEIRFRTSFKNTIYEVMSKRACWRETTHPTEWDFLWVERDEAYEVFDNMHLGPNQMINHFRNDRELCRKDLLIKNLKRRRRLLAKKGHRHEDFNFWPTSFVLPSEYSMFVEEFKRSGGTWIMKPISKSQGKGIFLFKSLEEIDQWRNDVPGRSAGEVETYIVQRYISHPLLIGGKKFDMRLYALVTSWSPLVVWIYRSGFCRFSSTAYSSTELDNMVAHLTNVAVQKKSSTYDADSGGKWELRQLKLFLMSRHGLSVADAAFEAVQRIIIQSLEAVQPVIIQDRHCFELYGYDILFDQELKPWLLEVNGAPSLTANTTEDRRMKCDMLSSLLDVVDMEKRRSGNETRIGGFDLAYNSEVAARHVEESYAPPQLPKLARREAVAQAKPRRAQHQRSNSEQHSLGAKKELSRHNSEISNSARESRHRVEDNRSGGSTSGSGNNGSRLSPRSFLGAAIPRSPSAVA